MARSLSWVAGACLCLGLAGWLVGGVASPWPVFGAPVMARYATLDMSWVLTGQRRWGADLAFLQFLQYYGTSPDEADLPSSHERPKEEEEGHHGHHHISQMENHAESSQGPLTSYKNISTHITRIGSFDPYFHYAYLLGAGALAFNLNRYEESLDLLEAAARADPTFWKYRLYGAAIAYRKGLDTPRLIESLETAIQDPDCPSMVKSILAGLHKKRGNFGRAAEIYRDLIAHARDINYAEAARTRLEELLKEHPGL